MKWIGQHIWNFISRFRNDVYIESLEEQDQDFSVMVSSNGKLTKSNYPIERARIRVRNDEGSTIPLGSALYCKGYEDNRILVGLCDNSDASKMPCIGIAVAEMNTTTTKDNYGITQGLLTTTIPVTGAILVNLPLFVGDDGFLVKEAPTGSSSFVQSVGVVVKTDVLAADCEVLSVSITNQVRDRDASGIKGLQNTNTDIKSEADLKFYIDSDDGAGTNKFYWYDHTNSIMELDNSGNLQLDGGITTGSTSFVNSSGVVQVATQGTIDHDSLANFEPPEHYRWDNDIQSTATINHANLSSDTGSESEVLVINDGDAVWGHPEKIHLQVRNDEGSTIPVGAPLYSKGEIGGSNRILVGICDADDPAKMPCIGLAEVAMNTTSTKDNFAITQGIYNTNIAGFTSLSDGDILYINTSGSAPYLTKTKPTGESSLIQNIGIVLKTNGTICQALQVSAIGRTNDVPNLNSGHIFYGNGSNQAVSTQLSSLIPTEIDDLTDVDVSTSSPQVNQVLMFNGLKFVAANEGSTFVFVWNSVEYNNNVDDITDTSTAGNISDTVLIGSGDHITSSSVTLNFQNAVSSDFTSGVNGSDNLGLSTQAWNGSMTGRTNLSFDQPNQRATASTGTISLPFPSSLSSTSYNRIKVRFQYDGSDKSNQLSYSYKNYMYLGKHTDDSPTNSELQSFQKKSFINNGTSNTTDISAFGITLNGTSQHLQFWYPSRITTTPSFNVGASAAAVASETWTLIDSGNTISHTNSAGFTETYKGWKSPNPLDNSGGVSTWYVQVIF